jgi:hypothetical protein
MLSHDRFYYIRVSTIPLVILLPVPFLMGNCMNQERKLARLVDGVTAEKETMLYNSSTKNDRLKIVTRKGIG